MSEPQVDRSSMPAFVKGTLMRLFVPALILLASSEVMMAGEHAVEWIKSPGDGEPLSAAVDSSGRVHLIMNSPSGPVYASSADEGRTFSKPIMIVDENSRKPGLEFLAWDAVVTKDGRVHVVMGTNAWKLKLPKEEWGCFLATLHPGESTFSTTRNINRVPSEGFSIAAADDGTLTVCWLADRLFVSTSRDHGATFNSARELSSAFDPCNCCTTSCDYGADGRLAILYREETNNDRDMYVVLWNQTTNDVQRSRIGRTGWHVDACPMTYYSIAERGDGYDVVWPTKKAIFFSQLNGDGSASSADEVPTKGLTGMRTGMTTLRADDGTVLVVWNSDQNIGWQLFDSDNAATIRTGTEKTQGKGVAGFVRKDSTFVLFR